MEADAVKVFPPGGEPGSPVIFVGRPSNLRAQFWLENDGDVDLRVRAVSLFVAQIPGVEMKSGYELARIAVAATVPPRQRRLLTPSLSLDATAAPGTYDAEMQLESAEVIQRVPARIVVTPNYSLSLQPDEFVIAAGPGATVRDQVIVVRNEGNVPVVVPPLGEFPLRDPARPECVCWCVQMDGSAFTVRTATPPDGPDGEGEEEDDEEEFGSIRIDNNQTTVPPGLWALIQLNITVPEGLPANAHLQARPRVGIERFKLDLLTPAEESAGPKRPESPRRRKPKGEPKA